MKTEQCLVWVCQTSTEGSHRGAVLKLWSGNLCYVFCVCSIWSEGLGGTCMCMVHHQL